MLPLIFNTNKKVKEDSLQNKYKYFRRHRHKPILLTVLFNEKGK